MIVNINEEYRFHVVPQNRVLEHYEEPKPTKKLKAKDGMTQGGWKLIGYYGTEQQVLRGVMQHSLEHSKEVLTLDGYISKIDVIVNTLEGLKS